MIRAWAEQYDCPCVVVVGGETADEVVAFAHEVGALSYLEGPEALVVEFRDDPGRMVGPELYTESALRRSIKAA